MAEEEKLKLGKGVAFVKSRLKRLPQEDDTWEADFRALPRPMEQTVTHYEGMVVEQADGWLLAEMPVQGRPSVNDLATLLAHAMRQPLPGNAHRPRLIRFRGHHQWRELFPHLAEIGIEVEVSIKQGLHGIEEVYEEFFQRMREEHQVGMVKPSPKQESVETMFPAIARWVQKYGWVEIGEQELFGFVARALNEGGTKVEDDRPNSLAEALAALEKGLTRWFEEQGVELD